MRSLADEVPFDIPDSWEWVRISSIAALVTKGTTPRGGNVAYSDNGIGFLRAENVAGLDRLDLSKLNHIDEATHTGFLKRSILAADDVLITIAGTLGRTAIVKEENLPLNANQAVAIIRLVDSHSVDLRYLVYALNAPAIQDKLTAQKKITAIPNLTLEIISDCLVPIPPLNEQRRIVKQFALFVPQIAEYEGKQTELNALNTVFPEALKKSILQEAVQGKLVPQDPSDEPAEALLERIRAEKQRLIKEGKIKKDKHESVIFRRDNSHYEKLDGVERCIDDELPFEIPQNWCWVRFGTALVNRDAERIPLSVSQRERLEKKYDYYGASGVIDKVDRYIFDKPLLLIGEDGANLLLRSKPIAFIAFGQYWVNNHAHVIDAVAGVDLRYIALFINATNLAPYVTGTAQPKMNQEKLNSILVPLPPTAEQRRIVSAFEEIAAIIQQF